MRNALLLFLALLVAGCGPAATATPVPALAIPWGAGDRAEYSLTVAGQAAGTLVFTTAPGTGGGYVLTTETTAGAVKDVSKVRVDGSLVPLGATREVTGAGASDFSLMTVYDGKGKLSIEAKTSEGTKAATISVPSGCWDNDESLFAIRALPLAENYKKSFALVVGATANVVTTNLAVVGKEDVEVPAGRFTTYKVELTVTDTKLYAWYDASAPHHLVKYESSGKTATGTVTQTISLTKTGT